MAKVLNRPALVGGAASCSLRDSLTGPFWVSFWRPGILRNACHLHRTPASLATLSAPERCNQRAHSNLPSCPKAGSRHFHPGEIIAGKEARSSGASSFSAVPLTCSPEAFGLWGSLEHVDDAPNREV